MEELQEYLSFSNPYVVVGEEIIIDDSRAGDRRNSGVLSPLQPSNQVQCQWTRAQTLKLFDCYKTIKSRVGTQMMTKKKLWVLIAELFGEGITPSHCENRWKVLERNFKAFVDNKIKTGRGRKNFEYAEEMEAIFEKKKNISPTILLNSTTVSPSVSHGSSFEGKKVDDEGLLTKEPEQPKQLVEWKKKKTRARFNVLDCFRQEKKKYHEEMIQIHKARLEIEKERLAALHERNRILAEKSNCCHSTMTP